MRKYDHFTSKEKYIFKSTGEWDLDPSAVACDVLLSNTMERASHRQQRTLVSEHILRCLLASYRRVATQYRVI